MPKAAETTAEVKNPKTAARDGDLILSFHTNRRVGPALWLNGRQVIYQTAQGEFLEVDLARSVRAYRNIFLPGERGSLDHGPGLDGWLDLLANALESVPQRIYGADEAPPRTSECVITPEKIAAAWREERRAFPQGEEK